MDEENIELENEAITGQLSIGEEKSEAIAHKDSSLQRLNVSFNKHIELAEYKKTHLLAYWITDFSNYHDEERTFSSASLRTFKRGDIVKVNLGFNVGGELGGLHYCVVINKTDNPNFGTLNVIPLSSAKEDKNYFSTTCIDLGDELYNLLQEKHNHEVEGVKTAMAELSSPKEKTNSLDLSILLKRMRTLDKIEKEIAKMKHGSIAYIHQITTVSKQRIFKTPILSNIRLSDSSLDAIDAKIKSIFTK